MVIYKQSDRTFFINLIALEECYINQIHKLILSIEQQLNFNFITSNYHIRNVYLMRQIYCIGIISVTFSKNL
jgi:hypothetical protein